MIQKLLLVAIVLMASSAYALDYGKLGDTEKAYVNSALRMSRALSNKSSPILSMSNEEVALAATEWAKGRKAAIDKKIAELQAEKAAMGE